MCCVPQISRRAEAWRGRALRTVLGLLVLVSLVGCTVSPTSGGGSGTGTGGGGTPDPYANMTGNWQFQTTATKGTVPFTALSGFVNELNVDATAHSTSASLMPANANCYPETEAIPLTGNVQQAQVYLSSFTIDNQVLTLSGTKNQAGTSFTGTYSVTGGCADGATGTVSGTFYQTLNGNYAGAFAADPTKSVSLNVAQYALGTANGNFLISGTANVQGFSCFSSGTMSSDGSSYVSGNTAVLVFATSDGNGAQLVLTGTFDPAVTQITVSSIQVEGDSCSGSYGGANLAKQ